MVLVKIYQRQYFFVLVFFLTQKLWHHVYYLEIQWKSKLTCNFSIILCQISILISLTLVWSNSLTILGAKIEMTTLLT